GTQRRAGMQVEGQGDCRKLTLVDNREWGRFHVERRNCTEWYQPPGGRLHVDFVESFRSELKPRIRFEDHAVLAQLGENGRYLALAKGIVERIVDGLRKNV